MPGSLSPDVLHRAAVEAVTSAPMAASAPASAPPRWPLYVSLGMLGAGQTADAISTYDALKRDGTQEGNGIYGDHPSLGRLLAVKAATMVPLGVLLEKAYPTHPKLAALAANAVGALGIGLALHNQHQGR